MYGSTSSPQLFSDFALFQPCTESQDTALYLLVPCSVLLSVPILGLGGSAGCWQHTHQYCCSQPPLGALHTSPALCEHVQGLLAEVADALLSQHSHGQGHSSENWNRNLPREKKNASDCLEALCIHCPEAERVDGQVSPQWLKDFRGSFAEGWCVMLGKASRHSGENITDFWMYRLAPEDVTREKCGSLAREAKWKLKCVCACMKEGFSDTFFHFSYTQVSLFHYSQKGVTVSKAITSISCRYVPLTMSLCYRFPVRTHCLSHHSCSE